MGRVDGDGRGLARVGARGANRRQLLPLAAAEAGVVGLLAGLLGAGLSFAAVALLIKGSIGLTVARAATVVVACVVLAIVGAVVARMGTGLRALTDTVAEGRRSARREGRPLWQRLYLDLLALAVSGLIYWLTASTGFSAVVSPDSNPTLSLSIYMFFAPALLWIGATLLLVRLRGRALAWLSGRLAGKRAGSPREFLLASASRRGAAMNRSLLVIALLLAFRVNLAIFTATYDQHASVDAQLTL